MSCYRVTCTACTACISSTEMFRLLRNRLNAPTTSLSHCTSCFPLLLQTLTRWVILKANETLVSQLWDWIHIVDNYRTKEKSTFLTCFYRIPSYSFVKLVSFGYKHRTILAWICVCMHVFFIKAYFLYFLFS